MHYKPSKHIRRAKFLVEKWNKTVQPGDWVEYEPLKGDKSSRRLYKTRDIAFLTRDLTAACIFLIDFSGYVDLEFLHPVKNKQRLYQLNKNTEDVK